MAKPKYTFPMDKPCLVCGAKFSVSNRYQAARKKACSKECSKKLISIANSGKTTPVDERRVTQCECPVCGVSFYRSNAWLKRVGTPVCSRHCNGKLRVGALLDCGHKHVGPRGPNPKLAGENNPAWKGGVTKRRGKGNYKGAKYVRAPEWASIMSRKDGYVMEHRLAVAIAAGRTLTRTEVVHHINHDSLNNSIDNLELWPDNRSHKIWESGVFVDGAYCKVYQFE